MTPANPTLDGVLAVSRLRVSPRYNAKSFVYRLSASKYEQDYYNQFLVAPGDILTEEVRQGLAKAQLFRLVRCLPFAQPGDFPRRLGNRVGEFNRLNN